MNEFIAGKLGEVLAFARMGRDTLSKGEEGFLELVELDEVEEIDKAFGIIESGVLAITDEAGISETVEAEANETFEKVTSMRDTYIEENWGEPTELLEWMGFYTGASLVHWYLVAGAAEKLGFEELHDLARSAIEFYSALFVSDEDTLRRIGAGSVEDEEEE